MQRRPFLLVVPAALLGGIAMADTPPARTPARTSIPTLDASLLWLDGLQRARSVKSTGAWPLGAVLEHLAQSIEMSMEGFPQPRSELFQRTAGIAAFNYFKWR